MLIVENREWNHKKEEKRAPIASLKLKKFFVNKQPFSKPDVLLFISKRIKHNKKLAKKGVGMGV